MSLVTGNSFQSLIVLFGNKFCTVTPHSVRMSVRGSTEDSRQADFLETDVTCLFQRGADVMGLPVPRLGIRLQCQQSESGWDEIFPYYCPHSVFPDGHKQQSLRCSLGSTHRFATSREISVTQILVSPLAGKSIIVRVVIILLTLRIVCN